MKILVMNERNARAARQHPAIKGKKLLATGQFSAVYEGSTPDTVHKLTVDPAAYWLFNDGVVGVAGKHFPKTVNDFGSIGDTVVHANLRAGRPREVPIFLYEQERLVPLPMKSEQRRLASKIIKAARAASGNSQLFKGFSSTHRARDVDDAKLTLNELSNTEELPVSLREAAYELSKFCDYYDDLFLDMHYGNFMVRPETGDLIFSDPFGCSSIFRGHKNYDYG